MPEPAKPTGNYVHLIGGEAGGRRHEPGEPVNPSTPPRKIQEWLRAGIIKSERTSKTKERRNERRDSDDS